MNSKTISENLTNEGKTRRQKVEDREQAIVGAAHALINDVGYAKTTIAEIALKSGVADGTVYLYFKNKEAVANAVLTKFYKELTLAAQAGVDSLLTPIERIRFLATHHLTEVIAHWRLLEMLPSINVSIENYAGSDLYRMNKAYVAVFDLVAKDAAAQGNMRNDILPWILRDNFFGAMDYGARTIMMKGNIEAEIGVFVDNMLRLMFEPNSKTTAVQSENNVLARIENAALRIEKAAEKLAGET